MNKHLNELIELSKNDLAIDSFTPRLELADKKLVRIQKKIDKEQKEFDKLSKEISENKESVVKFETQLTVLNNQLKASVKKSKIITTEKEMKALSLEDSLATKKISFANEEITRLQEINGKKQQLAKEVSVTLETVNSEITAMQKVVGIERADIDKSKIALFSKREELSRNLEQKVLAFYEKIRIWAGNTAVVPVKKQACYGCYMKLNDKTYSEVIRADEICNCPHCGRIIYIDFETAQA